MASSWSDLKIQLMGTGENTTTWGAITNANLGTAIEDAITGSVDVSFTGSNVTLSASNSTSAQDFRNLRLNLTGTGTGSLTGLSVPNIEKVYIVNNSLSDSVEVTSGTGANGTATIPNGTTSIVFCTGSNKVTTVINYLPSLTLGTPLSVASGGTGSNSGVNVSAVSGVLPIANGGTGSATAAFDGSLITNINATSIASGTLDNARTSANTANQANAIVLRDGQGSFTANVVTAASFIGPLTGNVTGTASGNTSTSDFTGSNQSFTQAGYQKLPGGLIIQWNKVLDGTDYKNFPIPFPTACLTMVASRTPIADVGADATVEIVSNTQYRVRCGTGVGNDNIYWIALGY